MEGLIHLHTTLNKLNRVDLAAIRLNALARLACYICIDVALVAESECNEVPEKSFFSRPPWV